MFAGSLRKSWTVLGLLIGLILIVAACAGNQPSPAAAPNPTAAPKATAPAPPTAPQPTVAPKLDWPTKDIHWIVPRKPGGGFDLQSRMLAPVWEKKMPKKVNVIIDNQGGAGGKIGQMMTIKAAPDGYTLGVIDSLALSVMHLNNELEGFDITKLTWLGRMSWDAGLIFVSQASGMKNVADLKSREIRVAGTDDDMTSIFLLMQRLGIKYRPVVVDTVPDGQLSTMRGDTDLMLTSWTTGKNMIDDSGGKLVPLFVIADTRREGWKEVPCSKELGLPLDDLYFIVGTTRLIGAPAGIPENLRKVMEDTLMAALQDQEFKNSMVKAGYDPGSIGNAQVAKDSVDLILKTLKENPAVLEALKQ